MTCKHPPDHVVTKYDTTGIPEPYELECRECLDCGTWLPLGPSNDDSEAVRIEMRAAELAAEWKPVGGVRLIGAAEMRGWGGWPYRQPETDAEHTGFLAAQILNHERDLGDVNWSGRHMADHKDTP